MPREEAQKAFPGVVFVGDQFTIGSRAVIESGARIENGARIESRARIESGAVIGSRAVIGRGAVIESGTVIGSVSHKYTGNVVPLPDKTLIRIGCEVHTPQEWDAGDQIAQQHHELDWWQKHGKAMLQFLKSEAEQYDKEYRR